MTSGKWILFLSLLLTLPLSCQRSQDESANVAISLQGDLGGQSGQELMHVVINITGNDISPIFYTWDAHGDNGIQQSPPSSFNFSFPAGVRLIQVAAVYKKASGSGMDIFYGDSSRDFSAASENLNISVLNINQGSTMISGNISGRYLTGASQGPTGKVEIQYQPPNGRPAMTIEKGYIVNGWFNLFALSGVSLQYKVSDGTILWDGPVSLDNALFSTYSPKISRISVPVSKRKEYNGGSYSWMAEDAQIYVYGWFGPSASSEIVCQPSSLGYFTRLVNYNTPGLVNGSDPSPGYFLQMNIASTPPTAAQLVDTTASASYYAVATYGQTSSGVCSGYTELTNKISLNQSQFDGQGRDGASAFFSSI